MRSISTNKFWNVGMSFKDYPVFNSFAANLPTILLRLIHLYSAYSVLTFYKSWMFFCPTNSELCFYGCCHPCFLERLWQSDKNMDYHSLDRITNNFLLILLSYFQFSFNWNIQLKFVLTFQNRTQRHFYMCFFIKPLRLCLDKLWYFYFIKKSYLL